MMKIFGSRILVSLLLLVLALSSLSALVLASTSNSVAMAGEAENEEEEIEERVNATPAATIQPTPTNLSEEITAVSKALNVSPEVLAQLDEESLGELREEMLEEPEEVQEKIRELLEEKEEEREEIEEEAKERKRARERENLTKEFEDESDEDIEDMLEANASNYCAGFGPDLSKLFETELNQTDRSIKELLLVGLTNATAEERSELCKEMMEELLEAREELEEKKEEEERKEAENVVEIKVDLDEGRTDVEIKINETEKEFEVNATIAKEIAASIANKTGLDASALQSMLDFKANASELEVEGEIEGDATRVEVEAEYKLAGIKIEVQVKFTLDVVAREEIVSQIAARTGLASEAIERALEIEVEEIDEGELMSDVNATRAGLSVEVELNIERENEVDEEKVRGLLAEGKNASEILAEMERGKPQLEGGLVIEGIEYVVVNASLIDNAFSAGLAALVEGETKVVGTLSLQVVNATLSGEAVIAGEKISFFQRLG